MYWFFSYCEEKTPYEEDYKNKIQCIAMKNRDTDSEQILQNLWNILA